MIRFKYLFIRNYKNKKLQVRPHVHDCYEFVYYYKAKGECTYYKNNGKAPSAQNVNIYYLNDQTAENAKSFTFTDNSYALFEPYTVHDERHQEQASLISFGFYMDESCHLDIRNSFHTDVGAAILPYINQINDEYRNKFANYENMICALIMQILTLLYRKENKQINNDNEIAVIKNYIDEYYTTDISVSKLATLSHYSPDHFYLKFKNAYKVSPKTYIIEKRIALAKQLLTNTTLPLGEIALRCGYEDYLTFSQIFKAKVGVSPKNFRASLTDNA